MNLIELTDVIYAVSPGMPILNDINLTIYKGKITTIIGPNGAGKTSLIKLMLGLYKPTAGLIQRHKGLKIGYVPQKLKLNPLLPITVERFLELATPQNNKKLGREIEQVLHKVGSCHLRMRRMQVLSGGETQRILLARALLQNPDLLVLDEPAQGVDIIGQSDLYHLIAQLRNQIGCGVVLVSHDLHLVMAASDEVICLNHHICCSGTPSDVQSHPSYAQLFGAKEVASTLAIYTHHHSHRHDHSCQGDHNHD
nr:metal ABC transporter ATP-binding protein [Candidatus Odyssella thessalonicensis]